MRKLLKQSFDLFVKKRWLKTINKECDKYIKLIKKADRQQYIINALLKRYQELYGEDLRNPKKGGAE